MRVTLDSTPAVYPVGEFLLARRWDGVTDSGIPVLAMILAVSPQTDDPAVAAQFAAELHELPARPGAPDIEQGYGAAGAPLGESVLSPVGIASAKPTPEVDRARVEPLVDEISRVLLPELARQPLHPENVFVALNALAGAAALVIAGSDERARQFFEDALADNIAEQLLQQQGCEGGRS